MIIEPLTLWSGAKMPAVGLGTWKIPREACRETVLEAIRTGYRHMDCACDCKHRGRTLACHLSCLQTRCRGKVRRARLSSATPWHACAQTATRRRWARASMMPSLSASSHAKLTRTSRGLRTVRTGYTYQPPACCTYRRHRAAFTYAVHVPASGVPCVPCTVAPQALGEPGAPGGGLLAAGLLAAQEEGSG